MTQQFTEAEVKMMIEAVAAWSFNLSPERYTINHERILSVQEKLEQSLQQF